MIDKADQVQDTNQPLAIGLLVLAFLTGLPWSKLIKEYLSNIHWSLRDLRYTIKR